jgi:hydroxymethylpyrimidine pyrophosphatase-like HAD family hydrolase
MENNRKLLFFDIDKTLLTPYPWTVPDSAKQALKEARYNGHLLFINSGRTYTMIPEIIKEMGFDGYVCPNDQMLAYHTTNRSGYR